MHSVISKYAASTVPRYTSYPTAPHFNETVDGNRVADWLADLPADMPLSIYLHVPYCRHMCAYCGCHTKVTKQDRPLIDYAQTLRQEIRLIRHMIGRRQTVNHIHWGGGTPSLLPPDQFTAIADDLATSFSYTEDMEHAMEIDPRSLSAEMISALSAAGVNRVSLGVQDFDADVQSAIGRVQPFAMVEQAMEHLHRAGINAVNFDLIYGLPHQTQQSFENTADLTADLAPNRIALFGYAHVPWFKKHQRLIDADALPGTEARLNLEAVARTTFEKHGYRSIGLDHFALPTDSLVRASEAGTLRRNFQGYTTDTAQALIGLGASSISQLPQGYAQNSPDIAGWRRNIRDGRLAAVRGRELLPDDKRRGAIIEDLMTGFTADFSDLITAQPDVATELRGQLQDLADDGLISLSANRLEMVPEYRSLVRIAASVFDAYLKGNAQKHSVAV